MTVRPPTLFSRHAFRPAFQLTIGLWAFGFILLAVMMEIIGRGYGGVSATISVIMFCTTLPLAAMVLWTVLRMRGAPLGARLVAVGAAMLVAVLIQALCDVTANWAAGRFVAPAMREWAGFNLDQYVRAAFLYFWVFGLNLVLIHLSLANTRVRDQEAELIEAKSQAAQAQLAMLRYQLNPHFLFNTLNAISTLVVTRRNDQAEEMLGKLSGFLRGSLASDPNDYVTLDAELDVIQDYLDIEGVRFGERLAVDFACDPRAGPMLVPSFILQPLVENAIKYAVGPARRTVTIKIDARLDGEDLLIMVTDDGEGEKGVTRGGTGVGLRNVRARLNALYGERGIVEAVPLEQGFLAIVRLPATRAAESLREAAE